MNSLKSIASRITSVSGAVKALDEIGISVKDSGDQMRDVDDILDDLGAKWKDLSAEQQQNIGIQVAGRYQLSRFLILMEQYDTALEASNTALNSAGSGYRENAEYLKSYEAQINMVKNAWTEAVLAMRDAGLGDAMILGLQVGLEFFKVLTIIIDKIGLLPTLLGAGTIALTAFNPNMRASAMTTGSFVANLLKAPPAFARFQASMVASSTQMSLFNGITGMATKSVGLLGTGLRFLAGVALPVAGFMALGTAISWVTEKIVEQKRASDETKKSIEEGLKKNVEAVTINKEQTESLLESYRKLSEEREKISEAESNWDSDKEKEYLSIQQELASIFPSLVENIDKKGQAHLKNADAIEEEIAKAKELANIENAKALQEEGDRYKQDLKIANSYAEELDSINKKIENQQKMHDNALTEATRQNALDTIRDLELKRDYTATIYNEMNNVVKNSVKEMSDANLSIKDSLGEVAIETQLAFDKIDFSGKTQDEIRTIRMMLDGFAESRQKAFDSGNIEEFNSITSSAMDYLTNSLGVADSELKNILKSFYDTEQSLEDAEKMAKLVGDSFSEAGDEAEGFGNDIEGLGQQADETKTYMEGLEETVYELSNAIELMSGISQKHIDDSEELMWSYESLQSQLEGLDIGTDLYASTLSSLEGVTGSLLDMYPHLSNETMNLVDRYELLSSNLHTATVYSEELSAIEERLLELHPSLVNSGIERVDVIDSVIGMIQSEIEANDLLLAATAASRDGKLTAEEEKARSSLINTNARIKQINSEIAALQKLSNAYSGMFDQAKQAYEKAVEAGDDAAAYTASRGMMRYSQLQGRQDMMLADLQAELATATGERIKATDILRNSQEVLSRSTSRANKATNEARKAREKANKATKDGTKAQKDSNKAIEEATFVADKYKRALEILNAEIENNKRLQEQFPTYSHEYRKVLEGEITLQKEKAKLLQEQAKYLEQQIKSGKIIEYGVVTTQKQVTSTTSNRVPSGFSGRVTSNYGYRGGKFEGFHGGVDIAATRGTRLDSPVDGKVIRTAKTGQYGTYGNVVIVQDKSGMQHLFAHLDKIAVQVGQSVSRGMQIGNTGNTGRSSGPHLHYEVRNSSGKTVNPSQYLANARKKGSTTNTSTQNVQTTQKDVAKTQQAIDSAQSDIIGMYNDIENINQLIYKLEMDMINSQIEEFSQRRDSYNRILDFENEKLKTLDVSSQRYVGTLERQAKFLEYKQKANQDEMNYIEKMLKSNDLTAKTMDELNIKAELLKKEMLETAEAISKMNLEIVYSSLRIHQEKMDGWNYSLERSRLIMALLEEGTHEYAKELEYQKNLLTQQAEAVKKVREELQQQILTVALGTAEYAELAKKIQELSLEYWQLQGSIKDTDEAIKNSNEKLALELADKLIDAYKKYLEEKRDMHLKSIDDEMKAEDELHKKRMDQYKEELDAFRKIVQERIDAIDKEESERDYNKEMDKLQEERLKILNKINLLSMDDSYEAKAERKKLQEQLAEIDETIAEKQHKKEVEDRKENLNDILKDKEEEIAEKEKMETERHEAEKKRIDDLRRYWEQFYVDQLNDERKFAKMKEDIVKGNFDNLSKEFQEYIKEMEDTMPQLENTLDGTMQAVGTSIRQNIIDQLREAIELMSQLQSGSTGGGMNGSGGSIGGSASDQGSGVMSPADLKVMTAKFLAEQVNRQEKNPVRQQYIRDRASAMAAQGRTEGSSISASQSYAGLLAGMSQDDRIAFANYLSSVGVGTVSTPELQDFIRQYAKNLLSGSAHLDTGGMIPNRSGGIDGRGGRAVIVHPSEIISNPLDSLRMMETAKLLDNILPRISNFTLPNLVKTNQGGDIDNSIHVEFNVENMTGSKQDVKDFNKMFSDELRRKKGV